MSASDDRSEHVPGAAAGNDRTRGAWWESLTTALGDDALDDALDDDAASLPDPWGDVPAPDVALSAEQRAFLEALDDQPPVPRIEASDLDGSVAHGAATAAEPADDPPPGGPAPGDPPRTG